MEQMQGRVLTVVTHFRRHTRSAAILLQSARRIGDVQRRRSIFQATQEGRSGAGDYYASIIDYDSTITFFPARAGLLC